MVNSELLNEVKSKLTDGSAMSGDCFKIFEI